MQRENACREDQEPIVEMSFNSPREISNCQAERHSSDMVYIYLEAKEKSFKQLPLKYISFSSRATVLHLQKFVAKKLYGDQTKCKYVEILYKGEVLDSDDTLKFISITRWKMDASPIKLYYIVKK